MKKTHLDIIDPIHDFVRVNQSELEIIDTPIFQRLRRIKQLSGAHLIYPGAQHTRFEHSLGVMHIASLACQTLLEKSIIIFMAKENSLPKSFIIFMQQTDGKNQRRLKNRSQKILF